MRVAVFSDVHANLIALERFAQAVRGEADAYLCLGDVVDYGPWNDECLEMVCALPGITLLEGNHEALFLGKEDLAHEIPLVRSFYHHSRPGFTRTDLIEGLPERCRLGCFECLHTIAGRSIYPDTAIEVDGHHMVGHTHHQFRIERSGFTIVNPGSVGQNRRWIDVVNYLILDTEAAEGDGIAFHALPYDVERFLAELRARRYPEDCIAYYAAKPRAGL